MLKTWLLATPTLASSPRLPCSYSTPVHPRILRYAQGSPPNKVDFGGSLLN